jgi:hypothetical protein
MSKLIVEMEMPDNCKMCPMVRMDHYGQIRCGAQGGRLIHRKNFQVEIKRPSWCPIKGELPDEHGDLIDRDKAKDAFDSSFLTFRMKDGETMRGFYQRTIAELPTVIAAERKDDEQDI